MSCDTKGIIITENKDSYEVMRKLQGVVGEIDKDDKEKTIDCRELKLAYVDLS